MKAPHLNRRLTLEVPVRTGDGAGGYSEDWQSMGTLWADVTARSGAERFAAGTQVSRVSYRIVVRAAPEGSSMRPRPEQRFRDGGRVFLIRAVAERDPAGRYLTCFADEEVAA